MAYETVIGLEVHVELNTKTKIFCGCKTRFGDEPNTNVCPVCMGHPGTLPVLNEHALDLALKAAVALNCTINQECKFDRKNYFYPDLPKGYQISQYDEPVGEHGFLEITVDGHKKRIGITRVHLEEDAGKLMHVEDGTHSLVDYNRTGVPLIEIVSEPDLRSPEEARLYLEAIKAIMQYCEISDCKMEEGSLRCDANISLRPMEALEFGEKVELKNMNSFRNVERGLAYEVQRQTRVLDEGGKLLQETRRFNEDTQETASMRSKEEAHDYRYFPDPDLVRVQISDAWLERVRESLPELPAEKFGRYTDELQLSDYDAGVLTADKDLAAYFEEVLDYGVAAKPASNWIINDLLGYLNAQGKSIVESPISAHRLGQLIQILESGKISSKQARDVFREMCETSRDAAAIIQNRGYEQISSADELIPVVDGVIARNPQSVADFLAGKDKAIGALVGQIMKETKGQANPQLVNQLLRQRLALQRH